MTTANQLLKCYIVTWNVATKYPEQNLSQLLNLNNFIISKKFPDIYVIGLQEVKSQPQNIVVDIVFENSWTKSFREVLKEFDYVKLRTQRLQGLVLSVFVLRKHLSYIRSIDSQYTKTGFGGMWGNKGAISIRFNIYGVNICLVNVHLTPHDHLLADRIADYHTIIKEHLYNIPNTTNIFLHDYVFWFGDLNFRLAEGLTVTDINDLIQNNQLNTLLEKDQLKCAIAKKDAFIEFSEKHITFLPTYKYEFGSQEFDFKRRPSWTDRILYKVNEDVYNDVKLTVTQNSYRSHSNYVQSDHKPVSADFEIVIRSTQFDNSIEFGPIAVWYIDEENAVSYKFLRNEKSCDGDWIGLYHERFSSLDEYLVYEYTGRGKFENVDELNSDSEKIHFSDTAICSPGMYRLVYIAQRGDSLGILGMSTPFPGYRRQIF